MVLNSVTAFNTPQGREDIQLCSSHLEDWYDTDQIKIQHDGSTGLFIEWQVVSALEEWTTGSSQVLYIVGPSLAADQFPTSLIASELIGSAVQSQISTVSFFCELSHKKLPEGRTAEVEALIALTSSLIRQLIELLPIQLTSTTHLSQQMLELLDGSLETWEVATTVLSELLDLSPPMLFCVIDNFQELDHKSTKRPRGTSTRASLSNKHVSSTPRGPGMLISHRGELDMFAMGMVLIWTVLMMRDGGETSRHCQTRISLVASLPYVELLDRFSLSEIVFFNKRRVSLVKWYIIRH